MESLIQDLRDEMWDSETDDYVENSFMDRIQEHEKSLLISTMFSKMKSSMARNILLGMPKLLLSLSLSDLLESLVKIQEDELAMYYYCQFLAEIFGIDVHELGRREPSINTTGEANIIRSHGRGAIRPGDWSHRVLEYIEIDQSDLILRMQKDGAPMIL